MNIISCTPILLISPSLQIHPKPLQPPKRKKKVNVIKNKKNIKMQIKEKKISLWKLRCIAVCPPVYLLPSFACNVHCSESLVLMRAPVFCDTVNTGPSRGLLSDILVVSYVMGILQLQLFRYPAPSNASAVFRWSRSWGGLTQSPGSGPGCS